MRDEVKALRQEVERLRAEIENRNSTPAASVLATPSPSTPAIAGGVANPEPSTAKQAESVVPAPAAASTPEALASAAPPTKPEKIVPLLRLGLDLAKRQSAQ